MDNRQQRTVESFQEILLFLDRHKVRPEPPLLTTKRAELEACIRSIQALANEQDRAKAATSGNVDKRRRHLRRTRMMPLVRIARPILAFAPGAEAALRVPHARADALTVAGAALRMATALQPHAKLLVSAGYPKDFLIQFKAEAKELALVARTADDARKRRTSATHDLAAEIKKGMVIVTILEGLVMLHLGSDKDAVQYWRERRRVKARMGRPRTRRNP